MVLEVKPPAPVPGGAVWTSGSALARLQANGGMLGNLGDVVVLMPWLRQSAAQRAASTMLGRAGAAATVLALQDDLSQGPVALLNLAVELLGGRAEFLVYAAEDAFAGRGWLNVALTEMARRPEAGLFAFNDGKWFGQLAGFGMVRRTWLDTVYGGPLFHPGYRHHFGDTELTVVALQQRSLTYHPHALLVEVDHDKDSRPVHLPDRQLFAGRVRNGFDGRVTDRTLLHRFF